MGSNPMNLTCKSVDLSESITVPSKTIVIGQMCFPLTKSTFCLEDKSFVTIMSVMVGKEHKKMQLKLHCKHLRAIFVPPPSAFEGGLCLSMIVSDFAAAKIFSAIRMMREPLETRIQQLGNRVTCDMMLNWDSDIKEIHKILIWLDGAYFASHNPSLMNPSGTWNSLRKPEIVNYIDKLSVLSILSDTKLRLSLQTGNNGKKYLVFASQVQEEVVISDDDEDTLSFIRLPNGIVYRNGIEEVEVEFAGNRAYFPYERLKAIANGNWLAGDDIDFFLNYFYMTLLTEEQRAKIWIRPIKFFLDLNIKGSVDKDEQGAMEEVRSILSSTLPMQTFKVAGQEFSKDYVVIPVIYKDHWFAAIVVNPSAAVQPADATEADISGKSTSILIMDSLKDSRALSIDDRDGIFNIISYYLCFAKERCKDFPEGSRFNMALVKKVMVEVPQQNNASDCGVYLIKFVESFFKHLPNPNNLPTDLTSPSPEMFKDFDGNNCRRQLYSLICDITREKKHGEVFKEQLDVEATKESDGSSKGDLDDMNNDPANEGIAMEG